MGVVEEEEVGQGEEALVEVSWGEEGGGGGGKGVICASLCWMSQVLSY